MADRLRESIILPSRRSWLWLAAGLLFLLTFRLGSRGLNEPDEGRYANIARAMALSGDWWEPRMSGFGHYDKPPLIYWAAGFSFRVFGFNEWAARVPSLVGAVFALVGLGWAATRLYDARTAWFAVLICGASVQFWALARVLSPDMLLTGWCALAIGAWAECRRRDGAWLFWGLSLMFWSLAWWTKATPALIPLAGLALGVWLTNDQRGRRALRLWLLLPGILSLGSPWYLSMLRQYPELHSFFFGRELAGRMAGRVDGRHGSVIYYVPVSLVGWLPWWPLALWQAWRERTRPAAQPSERAWRQRLGAEGWIVMSGLLIFSMAASKLPTYTLTLMPWAALGLSHLVCRMPVARPDGASSPFTSPAVAAPAGVFALLAMAAALLMPRSESSWGVNSSMREVCALLKTRGATRVEADRYWPGMEFYLGDSAVRYVLGNNRQQERASDPGLPPDRFETSKEWLEQTRELRPASMEERWLVRFRKQEFSPFKHLIINGVEPQWIKIGHFDVLRLSDLSGQVTGPPPKRRSKRAGALQNQPPQ